VERAVAAAWANGAGSERAKSEGGVRGQETYDMWAPRFFLTPVDPMLRFRTPVKSIGSVHPRLQQKFI